MDINRPAPFLNNKPLSFFLPYFIFFFAIIYFIGFSPFSFSEFPLDDAWIHRVYSHSFAYGHGFQYNQGTQEAGSTSPLWAIISAPAQWFEHYGTGAVVVAVKFIGIIIGAFVLLFIQKITETLTESDKIGIATASLFAVEPRFLFSVLSGMETVLLIALWLSALYTLMRRKWVLSSILISLTPVTRPEAILILPLWILGFFLYSKHLSMLKRVSILIIILIPISLWGIFCKLTNGHWLPNTFYLKSRPFHIGINEINVAWQSLSQHGFASLFIFFIGIGVYILWSFIKNNNLNTLPLLLIFIGPLIYLGGVVGTRIIMLHGYYWTRWVDPAALIITVPFCIGYGILLTGKLNPKRLFAKTRHRKNDKIYSASVIALTIVTLIISLSSFYKSFLDRKKHLSSDSRAIYLLNVQAGKWIAKNTSPDAIIGVNDAGAIRYFGKRETIDLMGLNNSDIAFRRKTPDQIVKRLNWLVIFPSWFQGSNIFNFFEERKLFHIPLTEYTVCNCPGQTTIVIYKKKQMPLKKTK